MSISARTGKDRATVGPYLAAGLLQPTDLRGTLRSLLDHLSESLPPLGTLRATRRVRRRMCAALGYAPDLRHPKTFNEKVAWRILHDRNPLIPLTLDKIAVREWVADRVGPDLLVPLLGCWNRAADIPWESLPSSFALKASHGWNMNLDTSRNPIMWLRRGPDRGLRMI